MITARRPASSSWPHSFDGRINRSRRPHQIMGDKRPFTMSVSGTRRSPKSSAASETIRLTAPGARDAELIRRRNLRMRTVPHRPNTTAPAAQTPAGIGGRLRSASRTVVNTASHSRHAPGSRGVGAGRCNAAGWASPELPAVAASPDGCRRRIGGRSLSMMDEAMGGSTVVGTSRDRSNVFGSAELIGRCARSDGGETAIPPKHGRSESRRCATRGGATESSIGAFKSVHSYGLGLQRSGVVRLNGAHGSVACASDSRESAVLPAGVLCGAAGVALVSIRSPSRSEGRVRAAARSDSVATEEPPDCGLRIGGCGLEIAESERDDEC